MTSELAKSDGHTTSSHYTSDPACMPVCGDARLGRLGPAAVLLSPPPSLSLSPSSMSSHLHTYTHVADTSHSFNGSSNSISYASSAGNTSHSGNTGHISRPSSPGNARESSSNTYDTHNTYNTHNTHNTHQPPAEYRVPDYILEIRQQPQHARVALGKDKSDRKPIDPPPILQLKVSTHKDPNQHFLQSPYYFLSCSLLKGDDACPRDPLPSHLIGTAVSSLHRLKDTNNQDGGFFVFGDLSCKTEGRFRLLFTLYRMQRMECLHVTSTVSQVFQVYPTKSFPGLAESTFLTRSFSDQGVRLRLRKDTRSITSRKRNATAADFSRKLSGPGARGQDQGVAVAPMGRRLLGGRTTSADATFYGSGFDPSPSYGAYGHDSGSYAKRRRMLGGGSGGGGGDAIGAGTSVASVITTHPYGMPSAYGATATHMQMPVSTVGTGSYGLSPLQPVGLASMGYGGHAHTHAHHQLSRIATQPPPSARPSPHAFQYAAPLQPSPSAINDYRPLYTSTVPTAAASPHTHATTTPGGTSTSSSDAAASYTTQPGMGVAGMASFSQSMTPYTYAGALGGLSPHQHQYHHPHPRQHQYQYEHPHQHQHQHHPPPHQAQHIQHQQPSLQHVNSTGLGLDLNYTEVDRHNPSL